MVPPLRVPTISFGVQAMGDFRRSRGRLEPLGIDFQGLGSTRLLLPPTLFFVLDRDRTPETGKRKREQETTIFGLPKGQAKPIRRDASMPTQGTQ